MKFLKKYNHTFLKFIKVFLILISFYFLSMILVYSIPNQSIQYNVDSSLPVFEQEGLYYSPFFNRTASILDNFTDKLMMEKTIKSSEFNSIKSAMSMGNYGKYWHGYQIFLRPLMTIVTYQDIRFINLFIFFILLGIIFSLLKEKINISTAVTFLVSLMIAYSFIVPMSMQYMSVFIVMLVSSIVILHFYNDSFKQKLIYIFFITGSVTSFLDLLTTPLLTLGIPLVIVLLIDIKNKIEFKYNILSIFKNSISWVCGYGFTWVSKWILASIILKSNIITEGIYSILFRTAGSEQYPRNTMQTLFNNFNTMFCSSNILIFVIIIFVIIWLLLFVFYSKPLKNIKEILPLLLVSVFPYIWFAVLANHSDIHVWMTYRIQIITAFSLLNAMIYCIDFQKLKSREKIIFRVPNILIAILIIVLSSSIYINKYSENSDIFKKVLSEGIKGEALEERMDIYYYNNALYYVTNKNENLEDPFFVHITPENKEDLPENRLEYGFDNYDFSFEQNKLPLPFWSRYKISKRNINTGYLITSIRTGQYNSQSELWEISINISNKEISNLK